MWDGANPTQVVTIQSITFLERYNEGLELAPVDAHSTERQSLLCQEIVGERRKMASVSIYC